RHTRFSLDWSSDVCSSDLGGVLKSSMYASIGQKAGATGRVSLSGGSTWEHGSRNFLVGDKGTGVLTIADGSRVTSEAAEVGSARSEERCVGYGIGLH